MSDEDITPTIPDFQIDAINVPTIKTWEELPADTEIVKEDLSIATMQLQGLMAVWAMPGLTVGRMLRLIDGTIKAVKHRRDILGMPYGHIDKGPKGISFEPIP